MRRAALPFALLVLGAGCSGGNVVSPDGGTLPPVPDAGGCGAACVAPDAGECALPGEPCGAASCCPGLACDATGTCVEANPCDAGGVLLPNGGCGCDPALGGSGCPFGLLCDSATLSCVPDAGTPSLSAQPIGAACDPAAFYPDGGAAPSCAQPDAGHVDCVLDPSGVSLYVCAQACAGNADCPLAWQSCAATSAAGGHCADNLCTPLPATSSKSFFAPCPDGGGLCLPFNALVVGGGAAQVESYGLCVQASDAGPNSPCANPPTRGGPLCDAEQLCVLGRCRNPCNAADAGLPDAGSCLASELCAPFGVQPAVPGAAWAAGGCVSRCELDGDCDGGVDAGRRDGGPDAGDGG